MVSIPSWLPATITPGIGELRRSMASLSLRRCWIEPSSVWIQRTTSTQRPGTGDPSRNWDPDLRSRTVIHIIHIQTWKSRSSNPVTWCPFSTHLHVMSWMSWPFRSSACWGVGFGTSVLRRKAGSPEGCQGADGVVSGHFLGLLEYIGIHICQNLPTSVFNK